MQIQKVYIFHPDSCGVNKKYIILYVKIVFIISINNSNNDNKEIMMLLIQDSYFSFVFENVGTAVI